MSDLRFLDELGAEFKRIGAQGSTSQTPPRRGPRWVHARKGALEAVVAGAAVLLVVGVAALVLSARSRTPSAPGAASAGVKIVFTASALDPRAALGPASDHSIDILRLRLESVFHEVRVSRAGSKIVVVVPGAVGDSRARIVALAAPAHLALYDWETNVLLPDGRTVASELKGLPPGYQNNPSLLSSDQRLAFQISEGAGAPGVGSLSLYGAVRLASQQPIQVSADNAREWSQYYLFGQPGSTPCAIAGKYYGYTQAPREHCLLSGPDSSLKALYSGLPPGIGRSQGQILTVPQGTVVLEAIGSEFSAPTKISNPSAQFYVLRDHAALFGTDITHPRQSTDPSGAPDVAFDFTTKGGPEFEKVTGQIAARGEQVSGLGPQLNQHFAIALDQHLLTVPQIDFKQYPNGITGGNGADITGGLTTPSAQTLATLLRFGPLPVSLLAH